MVSGLCRVLGPSRLDLVEDVVQEALARALRAWPADGVPDNPEGWVFRVARNLALDSLRRQQVAWRVEGELAAWADRTGADDRDDGHELIADDTLRMLFLCSHPAIPPDARVPLILKTVCGFGVPAIAAALLQKEATIAQRLVRAKARLQGSDARFELPPADELPRRLDLVLEVIYLLFNEGYRAHRGSTLVDRELVEEAVRLAALLLELPGTATPETHALLALMLFLGARLPARTDAAGEILTLAEQDRSRWDRAWVEHAFAHFRRSIGGDVLTPFHCEAAIASLHTAAPSYEQTNWPRILEEYDRLAALTRSPIVRLNRAVAVAKVAGTTAGLAALAELETDKALAGYFLLPATAAHFHWQAGDVAAAAAALERALALPASEPEQRLLRRRLDACRGGEPAPAW
ncbi:MAG: RNA polymerase subunit sigma-70 [Planctomycetes bacterium]|nr:RNA polymerase subunit sigma-70 [Planctomycetota bacterium]